ncbi:unnamed protein product [Amoebophrya sp. A25]|nr:unnamed protein product [Amoebophrya sp. A25]|eukprot:GSA25T00012588001.1
MDHEVFLDDSETEVDLQFLDDDDGGLASQESSKEVLLAGQKKQPSDLIQAGVCSRRRGSKVQVPLDLRGLVPITPSLSSIPKSRLLSAPEGPFFGTAPDEILLRIAFFLPSCAGVASTCRRWRRVVSEHRSRIWRSRFLADPRKHVELALIDQCCKSHLLHHVRTSSPRAASLQQDDVESAVWLLHQRKRHFWLSSTSDASTSLQRPRFLHNKCGRRAILERYGGSQLLTGDAAFSGGGGGGLGVVSLTGQGNSDSFFYPRDSSSSGKQTGLGQHHGSTSSRTNCVWYMKRAGSSTSRRATTILEEQQGPQPVPSTTSDDHLSRYFDADSLPVRNDRGQNVNNLAAAKTSLPAFVPVCMHTVHFPTMQVVVLGGLAGELRGYGMFPSSTGRGSSTGLPQHTAPEELFHVPTAHADGRCVTGIGSVLSLFVTVGLDGMLRFWRVERKIRWQKQEHQGGIGGGLAAEINHSRSSRSRTPAVGLLGAEEQPSCNNKSFQVLYQTFSLKEVYQLPLPGGPANALSVQYSPATQTTTTHAQVGGGINDHDFHQLGSHFYFNLMTTHEDGSVAVWEGTLGFGLSAAEVQIQRRLPQPENAVLRERFAWCLARYADVDEVLEKEASELVCTSRAQEAQRMSDSVARTAAAHCELKRNALIRHSDHERGATNDDIGENEVSSSSSADRTPTPIDDENSSSSSELGFMQKAGPLFELCCLNYEWVSGPGLGPLSSKRLNRTLVVDVLRMSVKCMRLPPAAGTESNGTLNADQVRELPLERALGSSRPVSAGRSSGATSTRLIPPGAKAKQGAVRGSGVSTSSSCSSTAVRLLPTFSGSLYFNETSTDRLPVVPPGASPQYACCFLTGDLVCAGGFDRSLHVWKSSGGDGIGSNKSSSAVSFSLKSHVFSLAFYGTVSTTSHSCKQEQRTSCTSNLGSSRTSEKTRMKDSMRCCSGGSSSLFVGLGSGLILEMPESMLRSKGAASQQEHLASSVTEYRGHAGPVEDLCLLHEGKTLVSASADGTARFWKTMNRPSHTTPASTSSSSKASSSMLPINSNNSHKSDEIADSASTRSCIMVLNLQRPVLGLRSTCEGVYWRSKMGTEFLRREDGDSFQHSIENVGGTSAFGKTKGLHGDEHYHVARLKSEPLLHNIAFFRNCTASRGMSSSSKGAVSNSNDIAFTVVDDGLLLLPRLIGSSAGANGKLLEQKQERHAQSLLRTASSTTSASSSAAATSSSSPSHLRRILAPDVIPECPDFHLYGLDHAEAFKHCRTLVENTRKSCIFEETTELSLELHGIEGGSSGSSWSSSSRSSRGTGATLNVTTSSRPPSSSLPYSRLNRMRPKLNDMINLNSTSTQIQTRTTSRGDFDRGSARKTQLCMVGSTGRQHRIYLAQGKV